MADKTGVVSIHGKEYTTVAKRLETVHAEKKLTNVTTEVLSHEPIVIKATITVSGNQYTGISSVSLSSAKMIEKQSPYEVAETSAVGRALAFAGYPGTEFASADEMQKAGVSTGYKDNGLTRIPTEDAVIDPEEPPTCEKCGMPATEKTGVSKTGKNWHGLFCASGDRSHTKWIWDK